MAIIYDFSIRKGGSRMGVTTVMDVASWFLNKEAMTHKKLQKMCYYTYAWYYTLYGKPLFPQNFEAWIHGPVCRELYSKYKDRGWNEIHESITKPDLGADIEEFMNVIYDNFSPYSADELENMTHNESPWQKARQGLLPNEAGYNIIDNHDIVGFYSSMLEGAQID